MSILFRKTAQGVAEIETRVHRLPPRMRGTLILVDGRRDVDELKVLLSAQADETLRFLSEHGFIESVGETVHAVSPAPPRPHAAGAAAAHKPTAEFLSMRQAIARAFNDELGPPAESFVIRVEHARTPDELRPLVSQGVQLVLAARGRAAADALAARLPAI
jgi:hypothetical protein